MINNGGVAEVYQVYQELYSTECIRESGASSLSWENLCIWQILYLFDIIIHTTWSLRPCGNTVSIHLVYSLSTVEWSIRALGKGEAIIVSVSLSRSLIVSVLLIVVCVLVLVDWRCYRPGSWVYCLPGTGKYLHIMMILMCIRVYITYFSGVWLCL